MSKKTFSTAPKPVNQPSLDAIAAFEQGGAGHDAKPSVQRRSPSVTSNSKPREVTNNELAKADEPTRRLSLDIPASVHKRFKTACSAADVRMTNEVQTFIERRTKELERESGLSG